MAAYPTYMMLGQEIFLGSLSEDWLTDNEDDRWDDAEASIDIYDHVAGAVTTYTTLPGGLKSNTQDAGDSAIVGMDVSMWRWLLGESHPSGMAVFKRTDPGVVGNSGSNRWGKTYAQSYSNIAAGHTALNTLITGRGDTMDMLGIFLGVGYNEAVAGSPTLDAAFKVDLTQLILDLRTDYASATTPIVLDLPPKTVPGFTSAQLTSLLSARNVIKQVAAADENVSYVSADLLYRSNGATKWFYTGEATVTQGDAMGKEMSRLVTGKGTNPGLGVPVYVILGDDNCVGSIPGTYLDDGADEAYSEPMANVKTWNWANNTWEALDTDSNSNTSTDGTSNYGPDISMGVALGTMHPDETVYLFKLGRNTSSLGNASSTGGNWLAYNADIYAEVVTEWGLAKTALDAVESVVPDVRGVALLFGAGEDVGTRALADAFLANLRQAASDYRTLFQTRVTGGDLTVAIVKQQDTGQFTQEWVDTVRRAVTLASEEDPAIVVVDADTARVNADNTTLAGDGILDVGRRIAAGFAGG
jgi:hypothetical protein